GSLRTLPAQTARLFLQITTARQQRQRHIEQHHQEADAVGGPDIGAMAAHGEKLGKRGKTHRTFSSKRLISALTQLVRASRRSTSRRMRSSSTAPKKQ